VINKYFTNGLKGTFFDLVGLLRQERYKKTAIEALNVDDEDWLFGCSALDNNKTAQLYWCVESYIIILTCIFFN